MLAQTLGSPARDRPIVLNGELVKLGFPEDILHKGKNQSQEIDLGFSIGREDQNNEVKVDTIFRGATNVDILTTRMVLISSTIQTANQELIIVPENEGAKLSRIFRQRNWNSPILLKDDIENGVYDYRLDIGPGDKEREHRQVYASIGHFLPSQILSIESLGEFVRRVLIETSKALGTKSVGLFYSLDFKSSEGKVIRKIIASIIKRTEERSGLRGDISIQELGRAYNYLGNTSSLEEWVLTVQKQVSIRIRNFLATEMSYFANKENIDIGVVDEKLGKNLVQEPFDPEIQAALNDVTNTFTKNLHYLGPLRDDPKMIYGLPPLPDSQEVGLKGEYTAAVLERFGQVKVECPIPPSSENYNYSAKSMKLVDAVEIWLMHMGLLSGFNTKDQGKMGVELSLLLDGLDREVDLTNVGVGVSQILPLLTLCLLAKNESIILIEQPELHLHPRVQMILGDFFLGIAKCGKQCIIETHSDRLINRVRRRIAESSDSTVMNLTQIYFVERLNGATKIITVEPNEYGAIPDWPKGFFDEVAEEAQKIIDAATKKRELNFQKKKFGKGGQ